MSEEFILIIATGRSGSTTLMRILNTIPNCNICGENFNCIENLLDFYINLKKCYHKSSFKYQPKSYKNSNYCDVEWYNVFKLNQTKNDLTRMIKNMYQAKKYKKWGFKEIRIQHDGDTLNVKTYQQFKLYLDTIRELFPKVKIIFNYRKNIEKQSKSMWWADNKNAKEILKYSQSLFQQYYNENKGYCYLIALENVIQRDKIFYGLFKFLQSKSNIKKINNIINAKK